MNDRIKLMATVVTVVAVNISANRTSATDVTISGATNASAIQATLSGGSGTGTITFTATATLTMDQALINVTGIIVNNTVTGTIDFTTTTNRITFADAAGVITLSGNAQLTIAGTNAAAGIDFAATAGTASAKTLTITSSSAGSLNSAVAANNLYVGRGNTVVFATSGGAADALNTVTVANNTGGIPIIDVNAALTIASLVISTSGDDVDFDIASSVTATVTAAFTTAGDTIIELIAVAGGASETLAFTGGLTLAGTSTLRTTNSTAAVTGGVTAGADGVTIDVDGSATIDTLTPTNNTTLDIAAGQTLTITNAVTVPASKVVTFTGTNDASTETLVLTGGMTLNGAAAELNVTGDNTTAQAITGTVTVGVDGAILDLDAATTTITAVNMTAGVGDLTLEVAANTLTTTIDVNDNTLTITESGAGTISTVQLDTSGGVVDLNTAKTITNTNATLTSGTATYQAAVATAGAINVSGAGGTLAFTETGTIADLNITGIGTAKLSNAITITDLDWTGAGTLDLDVAVTVTNADLASNGSIDVAAGITMTATNGVNVGSNDLTLTGPGFISRINATTGTITNDGGSTVSDLRATFGSGGTFIWSGTGSGSVTTLANALPGAGETFQKTGTGSLTITSGITTSFASAAGVVFDVTAGTLIVGAAGSNDDITFNDDADELKVASGATLTTYGSFETTAAGPNVNLDAAAGSTVNLSATSGAETFTALANDDFNLLGNVNLNGGNSDYTISDAFDYKFGNVNINTSASLINNNPGGEIKFTPGATVDLTGNATLILDGQATTTPITIDTTTGAGTFTINRGNSPNLKIANANVSRLAYTETAGLPADCTQTFTDVTFTASTGLTGNCDGTSTTGDDTTDDTTTSPDDTTTDQPTDTTTVDGSDTTDGASNDPVVREADDAGVADLANDKVDVMIDGLRAGTSVEVESTETGETTLTVGDPASPDLVVQLSGTEDGSQVDISITGDGGQILMVTNVDGEPSINININGLGDNPSIDAAIDANGDQTIALADGDGAGFNFALQDIPTMAMVDFAAQEDGSVEVDVVDLSGESAGVALDATNVFRTFGVTVSYDPAPDGGDATSRVIPGFPGLENEQSLGGSITLAATGLTTNSVVAVALSYTDADLESAGITESDLRLHRFNSSTSEFEPAALTDQGVRIPTGVLNDYGVDTGANRAWAEVTTLGQFVVGVPKTTQSDAETIPGCGGGGMCGTMGIICLPACLIGAAGMRRRIHRR